MDFSKTIKTKTNHTMMYKLILSLLFVTTISLTSYAQFDDRSQIISNIKQLFEGMRQVDSTMLMPLFEPNATLESVYFNKVGETVSRSSEIAGFITAVGQPREQLWDERIHDYDINIDGPLAIAWTPYSFYVDDTLSHCGVNVFTFVKQGNEWKIRQIKDTRKKTDCL